MHPIKTLFTTSLVMALMAASALAAPPGKGGRGQALTNQTDFEALKTSDQLILVCKTSDSIQIIDIKDEKHAVQLCKDGEMVHCPECKKEYKVTRSGNPATRQPGTTQRKVEIVNEDGELCMFYAKLTK